MEWTPLPAQAVPRVIVARVQTQRRAVTRHRLFEILVGKVFVAAQGVDVRAPPAQGRDRFENLIFLKKKGMFETTFNSNF